MLVQVRVTGTVPPTMVAVSKADRGLPDVCSRASGEGPRLSECYPGAASAREEDCDE